MQFRPIPNLQETLRIGVPGDAPVGGVQRRQQEEIENRRGDEAPRMTTAIGYSISCPG